jgi:hypothetical protein
MRANVNLLGMLAAGVVAACSSSGGDSDGLQINNTSVALAADPRVTISERWLAFLGAEAGTGVGGTDFNGDADTTDTIAVVVNMATRDETNLMVAAQRLHWAGSNLYLVVDEAADGRNWETVDSGVKDVLLHWSSSTGVLAFVDTLDDIDLAVVGTRVYFASESAAPAMMMESNVRVINSTASPTATIAVTTTDTLGALEAGIMGEDESLVFLVLDENAVARDLNGDADMTDANVLALLDGTQLGEMIRSTGLALGTDSGPFRAAARSIGDWLVGFLVSEAAQGGVSLNDCTDFAAAWHPTQCGGCAGNEDLDTSDQVLHYLLFADWFANPVTDPPRNSGLAGTDRIVAVANHVGVLSLESDTDATGCDLNNDADGIDEVFRWTQAFTDPDDVIPVTDAMLIHAIADVPGGTRGVTELNGRWVIAVDEDADDAADIDGNGAANDFIVGWFNPAAVGAATFTFDHQPGAGTAFAGTTWMGEVPSRTVLPMDFTEAVFGGGINLSGDGDELDSVPVFARFNSGLTELIFPGIAVAVQDANAGMVIAKNLALYRVSEAADGRDWNDDADMTDIVLFRSSTLSGFSVFVDDVTSDPGPAVHVDFANTVGAAYFVSETDAGVDLNGDGDLNDDVLRWFRY